MNAALARKSPYNAGDYLMFAWGSVIALPAFWIGGFAAAHIPYMIWHHEEGSGTEPLWFGLICLVLFLLVQLVPIVVMWRCGHMAYAMGRNSGKYAYWFSVAYGIGITALMLITTIADA